MDGSGIKKRLIEMLPLFAAAALVPLVLWLVLLTELYDVSLYEAVSADSFVIFYSQLFMLVTAGTYLYLRRKRYGLGLMGLGLLMLMIQGFMSYGFGFEGTVSVGEGDEAGVVNSIYAGRWARLPRLPLSLISTKTDIKSRDAQSESCTVMLDGRTRDIVKGEEIEWDGVRLSLEGLFRAPLFILSTPSGKELEGGYIKLDWSAAGDNFFQFRFLPHRFYVSLPDTEREMWRREGKKWRQETVHRDDGGSRIPKNMDAYRITTPDRLHIRIMRNKLTLFDKTVSKAEPVDFDGHRLVFGDGAPWAVFRIKKAPSLFLLYAGLAVFIIGVTVLLIRRDS